MDRPLYILFGALTPTNDNASLSTILVAFKSDNRCIINCLVGKGIVETREFENFYVGHIENPTYLFIGLTSGVGFSIIKFIDAKEYKRMFRRKWNKLNKVH